MAVKSDSGDGSGEHGMLPEWNAGETEMLRSLFLEEAEKHLGRISEAQKSLARASSATLDISPDVVDVLFRHLHTLKGSAGSVGFDAVARAGATAIVQPGGSVRDAELIAAADEQNIAMVFTGFRHFRH